MNDSFFGRVEFLGGRYVVSIPEPVIDERQLRTGDTVDVRIEDLAIRA